MRVLSLFDGISCGQVALERAGIKVDKYFASEIEKNSIKITQKNYPNTIQLGDVCEIKPTQHFPEIDLLIGGSPCQDLSNAQNGKGLEGKKSRLFYEFLRLLKELKPKYFLLENVSMKKEWLNIVSKELGVEPIKINSNLVSAQDRVRYYWTNIPNIKQPEDKKIILRDVMQPRTEIDKKYWYKQEYFWRGDNEKVCALLDLNGHDILKRVYNPISKCGTLTACRGGNLQKKVFDKFGCRKLTPLEYERLQTLPDNYTEGVADSHRYNGCGDGWTVDVIAHIFKGLKQDDLHEKPEVKDDK